MKTMRLTLNIFGWMLILLIAAGCSGTAATPAADQPAEEKPAQPTATVVVAPSETTAPPTATVVVAPTKTTAPPTATVVVVPSETSLPPTETAIPPARVSGDGVNRLDLFENTIVKVMMLIDGPRINAGQAGQEFVRIDEQTISAALEPYVGTQRESLTFTLKYDPKKDQYLLSIQTDKYIPLEDFPLTYKEGEGFSGQGTITHNDKEWDVSVTIAPGEKGYDWSIAMLSKDGNFALKYVFTTTAK